MGEEEKFAPGFRFIPTKEELIEKYLKGKDSGKPLPTNIIKEVELYSLQPEVLYKRFPIKRIQSRYFFTKLDKRFKNKKRRDRKVKNGGHWICSTGDKPVIKKGGQYTGGVYKTLTYYEGNGKSNKTGWIMTEYRLSKEPNQKYPTANQESDWVLCEIHYKGKKFNDDEGGDDYEEEDKEAEQEKADDQDQQEEGTGNSILEPWLADGASTSYSFACNGCDQNPLSRAGKVQAADASTSCRFNTCCGVAEIPCSGEVQAGCAFPSYRFSTCYGDHQTLFNREVQAADASTSYTFNTCYGGQHIPLGIEEEVQAVGPSISYSFSTCHGFSPVPHNAACSSITGNNAGLLPGFTHLQYDAVTDIPGSSQVGALLSCNDTGVDRFLQPFGDSHIVPGTDNEDSPLEQPPGLFACDWITENPEEIEYFCNFIQQNFPDLEEDTAWLPLPTEAAPPNNAQLGEQGVGWFC